MPNGPSRIEVTPDYELLPVPGGTVQLTAVVWDQKGDEMEDAVVEWSSTDATVATVDSTGLVTARAEGYAKVTARHDTLEANAEIVTSEDPERFALTAFYRAAGGDGWDDNTNWLSDEPLSTWYGVTADSHGRVTTLRLSANGLVGEIPREIGSLSQLGRLILPGNDLTGPIPSSIGKLKHLFLAGLAANDLTGPLPAAISEASALYDIRLAGNNSLEGPLPESITRLGLYWLEYQQTGLCPRRNAAFRRWLNGITLLRAPSCTASRQDRQVLAELYAAMGGSGWTRKDGWLTVADLDDWAGVSVDGSGRVAGLDLEDNNVSGKLPYTLVNLLQLTRLDVSGNYKLGGMLQEWITELEFDTLYFEDTGVCAPPQEDIADWLDEMGDWSGEECKGADSILVRMPLVYLTHPVQNQEAEVPLMAGRDALLRVFAVADSVNYVDSEVRTTFYKDGKEVHVANLTVEGKRGIPLEVDESRLETSHHALIPGDVLEPGLELVVELDPDEKLPLRDGSQRRIPESGTLELDVREMPEFKVTIVPIQVEGKDTALAKAASRMTTESLAVKNMLKMLPVSDYDFSVRETFHVADEANLLRDVDLLRIADGDPGYYVGIRPASGVAFLPGRTSLADTTGPTIAHEVGHNMSLFHASCGAPGVDPDYPHAGGRTGAWGRDPESGKLKSPTTPDLMSYCKRHSYWISDYHHTKALEYRLDEETEEDRRPFADRRRIPALVLWGRTGPGITLDPAIVVDAVPSLPEGGGRYRIEGRGARGGALFSLSFNPMIEAESGEGHFVFTLPLDPSWVGSLAAITLTGPNGSDRLDASVRRPIAIVTDRVTGRVRRLLRDFETEPVAGPGEVVTVSYGLPDEEAMRRGS